MRLVTWFFTSIAAAFLTFIGGCIDIYDRIDARWSSYGKDKKKNIRNNFQKILLVLLFIGSQVLCDYREKKNKREYIIKINAVTRKLNQCNSREIQSLKNENAEMSLIKKELMDTKIEVVILKEKLKRRS